MNLSFLFQKEFFTETYFQSNTWFHIQTNAFLISAIHIIPFKRNVLVSMVIVCIAETRGESKKWQHLIKYLGGCSYAHKCMTLQGDVCRILNDIKIRPMAHDNKMCVLTESRECSR